MANFSVGTVKCNKQVATAYIAYMVIGSYFEKAEMESPILEDQMKMDYCLMRTKEQEEIEERVDKHFSNENAEFIRRISGLRATVHVKTVLNRKKNRLITIWFETGFEEIVVLIDASGKCFITNSFRGEVLKEAV